MVGREGEIRNKEKEEEGRPEADRNVECKSVDCSHSLSFEGSPVVTSFSLACLLLFSSNFPFFYSPPLPFDSLFFFFICTATSFSAGTLYPVKLVNFLTANGGVVGLKSFHYHLVSFLAGKCSRCCSRCVTIDTETAFLSSFLLLFFFFSLLFTLFPDVDPFQFDANI